MKKRNPIVAALLSLFVPFYVLYWYYVTAKDMKTRGTNSPPFWLLYAPLLAGLATGFLVAVVNGVSSRGVHGASTNTNVLGLVLALFFVIIEVGYVACQLYYFSKFSEAAEQITNNRVRRSLAFVLFILLPPLAVYMIQDALNKFDTPENIPSNTTTAPVASPDDPEPKVDEHDQPQTTQT